MSDMSRAGYMGRILYLDLSAGRAEVMPLADDLVERYVGGMGFGVRLLADRVSPGVDAFSPENEIIVSTGPLSGTAAPLFAQTCLVTKSPLTGGVINSYCGGLLAGRLKASGYDALVITGKAPSLTWVWVAPGGVKFIPCPELAGKATDETESHIRRHVGDVDPGVMCIGLAGENRVRFASVMSATRALGRGGAGAVFRSKNLKAIAVSGDEDIRVADATAFRQAMERARSVFVKEIENQWTLLGMFSRYGTGSGMGLINERRALATANHSRAHFPEASLIDGMAMFNRYPTRRVACLGCPVHCGQVHAVDKGPWAGSVARGPEYETMYSLGSDSLCCDPDSLVRAHQLCEQYGMDTLSAGCTVAFGLEAAQKDLLPSVAPDGTPLGFGQPRSVLALLEAIAHRQGVGDILAEGTRRAAAHIGHGADTFAMNVKGMEFAAWMPQRMRGIALTFATSNRGACHKRAPIGPELMGALPMEATEGKAAVVKDIQDVVNATFTMVACRFAEFCLPREQFVALLNAATGMQFDADSFLQLGERIWNLERQFNLAAGIGPEEDRLPGRCFEPLADLCEGDRQLQKQELEIMLQEYYQVRGWDERGVPRPETLRRLGLR